MNASDAGDLLAAKTGIAPLLSAEGRTQGTEPVQGIAERLARQGIVSNELSPLPPCIIEWAPGLDPDREINVNTGRGPAHTDHYAGRHYLHVASGAVLGRLLPPPGLKGDALGEVFERMRSSLKARLDESVYCDPTGALTARRDGMLISAAGKYRVADLLLIGRDVDFSTGHIDAEGDVEIHGKVLSGFHVHSTRSIKVLGLVEAAEITAEQNVTIRTGIAGGGRAYLDAGGFVHVGYLDGVTGTIGGSLVVDRELVNCKLTVGESLEGRDAGLFGGEVAVTGSCLLRTLGSEADSHTTLILGDVPILSNACAELSREIRAIEAKMAKVADQERVIRLNPRPAPADRERLTVLAFEMQELEDARQALQGKKDALNESIKAKRKVHVEVGSVIHANVRLCIGQVTATFTRPLHGPVRICWDSSGNLMYRHRNADPLPLESVTHLVRAPQPGRTSIAA